jgi:hypothetical protein
MTIIVIGAILAVVQPLASKQQTMANSIEVSFFR